MVAEAARGAEAAEKTAAAMAVWTRSAEAKTAVTRVARDTVAMAAG